MRKLIILGITLLTVLLLPQQKTHALDCKSAALVTGGVGLVPCVGLKAAWYIKEFAVNPEASVDATVSNAGAALLDFGTKATIGVDSDTLAVCSVYTKASIPEGREMLINYAGPDEQPMYTEENLNQIIAQGTELGCGEDPSIPTAFSPFKGTPLYAATTVTQNVIQAQPPINFAAISGHYASKLPIINNTALATTYENTGQLQFFIGLWEVSRNVAFFIISIALLIIGIMIITRKKLSAQVVVNLQNSIPRVIIAMFLVAFSYVITAFFMQLANFLATISRSIILGFAQTATGITGWGASTGLGNYLLATADFSVLTSAVGGFVAFLFVSIAFFALWIVLAFKIMFLYIKIMLGVLSGPLVFALGAIPGNEARVTTWFKQQLAYALGVGAIFFLMNFAINLPLIGMSFSSNFSTISPGNEAINDGVVNPLTVALGGIEGVRNVFIQQFMSAIFLFVMSLSMMGMAFKAPGKIENALVGKK
jgi:hypothetical protein